MDNPTRSLTKMDIVIPFIQSQRNELQYCLRSIEKYVRFEIGKIWIIGDRTPTLQNVNQVVVMNGGNSRDHRIFNKIALACKMKEVSDDFLMMNDDHFFLRELNDIPYWFDGTVEEIAAYRRYRDGYTKALQNTHRYLLNHNLSTRFFDVHTPIVYNKKKFLKLEDLDWDVSYGYTIKSLYCNMNKISGEYMQDCKLNVDEGTDQMRRKLIGRPVFSVGDTCTHAMKLLAELYPDKSKWEI